MGNDESKQIKFAGGRSADKMSQELSELREEFKTAGTKMKCLEGSLTKLSLENSSLKQQVKFLSEKVVRLEKHDIHFINAMKDAITLELVERIRILENQMKSFAVSETFQNLTINLETTGNEDAGPTDSVGFVGDDNNNESAEASVAIETNLSQISVVSEVKKNYERVLGMIDEIKADDMERILSKKRIELLSEKVAFLLHAESTVEACSVKVPDIIKLLKELVGMENLNKVMVLENPEIVFTLTRLQQAVKNDRHADLAKITHAAYSKVQKLFPEYKQEAKVKFLDYFQVQLDKFRSEVAQNTCDGR